MNDNVVMRTWLIEPMPKDVRQALDRLCRAPDVARLSVMPDVHLAEKVCVGVVLATRSLIYPEAVGGDIGCGVAAVRLQGQSEILESGNTRCLLAELLRRVPFHKRASNEAALPEELADRPLSAKRLNVRKEREGRLQFGTLGRGNHFLEVQADEEDKLWLMVHSGSRVMGQSVRAHHLDPLPPRKVGLRPLDSRTDAGRAYLADAAWAMDYAMASRRRMLDDSVRAFEDLFGVSEDEGSRFDSHHNFVRAESHDGEVLFVHRKGALSADSGERAAIPGSMGTTSFHVEGRGCQAALRSSSHGAGRQLARGEARRRIDPGDLRRQMRSVCFDDRIADSLRDEAPGAYKDIRKVMRAQRDLTRIVRRLRPLVVCKAPN